MKITYKGGLRVEALHTKSKTIIHTDAPVDNNGKGASFSPTDLLASSVVSCILTIAGIHYENKGIELKEIKCDLKKIMKANPRRVGELKMTFDFGENKFRKKDLQIFKQIVETCPVSLSLSSDVLITTNIPLLLNQVDE